MARRRWPLYTLAGIVAFFAALVLFLVFALPGIVRSQAERIVSEKLHRQLVIDTVQIHPFTLGASILGLKLMEADGKSVFVSFDRLDLRLSAASIAHLAPVVRELHLVKPYAHFARTAANHYSTDDIVAALAAGPPKPPSPPDAPPPRFSINNIRVEQGRFVFDDAPKSAHHEITDFALGLPFVSTFPAEEEVFVEPHLSAKLNGAPLQVAGKALPFAPTREASVDIDLDDVDLPRYLEYLPSPPPVRLPSARLGVHVKLTATLAKDAPPQLTVAGKIDVKALEVQASDGKPLVKLAEVELAIGHAQVPAGPLDATLTIDHKGRVALTGDTALSPLHAKLALRVDQLDLLPLQPLFSDRVNLRVTRAALDAKGELQLDQAPGGPMRGDYRGDVALDKLATVDSINTNDFLNWDTLALRGIRAQIAPLSVHVDEVELDKLYARVIISPAGRINLQDIVKQKSQARISLTDASAAPAAAGSGRESATSTTAASSASSDAKAPAPGTPGAKVAVPPMSIGKVILKSGHVRYSDNFIKPRYSADLMDLNGMITGLSSDPASSAEVDVHGKVNDAPLLIGGHVNPLARELTLDIKASVHNMELAPLSPYSGKYIGYRIERGKLSFDVAYQLAQRQLHAQNRLVLDQLTFGEKVDSPSATGLPVQLAIALLKDRNGVIDLDLPIGGSLDDPEFSVGGLILKVLINLVTKAVTAPFALLGDLFGGGSSEELSTLAFEPGSADIPAAREPALKSLAKAMVERPGLKLDITGWADPTADREALRHQRLDARLRTIKREQLAERGALVKGAEVTVAPQERSELLGRAYLLDVVSKPAAVAPAPPSATAARPPASPASTAPPTPAQMEQALLALQVVSDDDLRALGNRRAQAAKAWLATIGLVGDERLALVDSKVAAPGGDTPGPGTAAAASASRVDFALR